MDDLFEIRRTATKGCGVFAKKAISSYAIIVSESPVITIKCTPGEAAKTDASIEYAFRNLSKKDQEIEYNFLLANLKEAEGLPNYLVAEGYLQAATNLAYQQSEYQRNPTTKEIVFLEAARCIEAWYQKGLELEKKYYHPGHPQIRDGTMAWEKRVSRTRCLQYLRMTNSLKARGEHSPSESGEDFAVRIHEGDRTLTFLCQDDTAGLIW